MSNCTLQLSGNTLKTKGSEQFRSKRLIRIYPKDQNKEKQPVWYITAQPDGRSKDREDHGRIQTHQASCLRYSSLASKPSTADLLQDEW